MGEKLEKAKGKWQQIRATSTYHNVILFLVFVIVSAGFWFILAFNDSVEENFNVRIQITNQPDSVTFISDIPERMHVSVRDKGTTLWRNGFLKHPTVSINFKEYSENGILRYTYSDFLSSLRSVFGENAQISSLSLDSLHLIYTTNKGKRVPIVINCKVYPALGSILQDLPKTLPSSVYVYGEQRNLDTIHSVTTQFVELKDISETTNLSVEIQKIRGVRIMPSSVTLEVPIEPLVKKEALITITPVNVPENETLLLFPSKVPVEYYVGMSRLNDDDDNNIELLVDYDDIAKLHNENLNVTVSRFPDRIMNLHLRNDSVEYAVVKE